MKPGTAKVKGRTTENLLVEYLRANGFPYAERRRLAGSGDRGDIAGVVGVVIEVKSGARIDLASWMAELAWEISNDRASYGMVVVRPKGRPNPEQWWTVMPLPQAIELLGDA